MCRSYEAESFGKEQIYVLQPQLYNRVHRITDTLSKGGNGSDLCLGRTLWLSGKRLVKKSGSEISWKSLQVHALGK